MDMLLARLVDVLPYVLLANLIVAPIGVLVIRKCGALPWFGYFLVFALLVYDYVPLPFIFWFLSTLWYLLVLALPAYAIVKLTERAPTPPAESG